LGGGLARRIPVNGSQEESITVAAFILNPHSGEMTLKVSDAVGDKGKFFLSLIRFLSSLAMEDSITKDSSSQIARPQIVLPSSLGRR